ncbi:MAG TPA: hypothetical protein VEU62_17450 [Bryobacterales bacterium]|nr:hypothetical protein [Bryobacterales bacterium]
MSRLALCFLSLALAAGLRAADVPAAEANLKRVQALVAAGAASRAALQDAERQLQDARDEQFLHQTLYAGNVTPQDVPEMLRAAEELRRHADDALAAQQKLAAAGAIPPKAVEQVQEEDDFARRQWELAQSRADLVKELTAMVAREAEFAAQANQATLDATIHSAGKGTLSEQDFVRVESAFYRQFLKPLPVSAWGETAVHRSMGFDHRDRFDVALNPDQAEGRWLMHLLERFQVPYIAFRHAVTGRATGAHIHIGLPSPRL